MSFTIVQHLLTLGLAIVIMLALAIYGWLKRATPAAPAFVWGMAANCAWAAMDLAGSISRTPESGLFWHKLGYLAVANVPLAWLTFALLYTGREKWVTLRNLLAVAVVPVLMVGFVWTNEWHHLFWLQVQTLQSVGSTVSQVIFGPAGWIGLLYGEALMLVSAGLIGAELLRTNRLYRVQTAWVLAGFLVPLAANALYASGLGPEHDLTTASLAVSGVLTAVGVFSSRLLDLVPVARDKVIEGMTDAIIVLDRDDRVVDLNPSAQRLLDQTPAKAVGQTASECFQGWPALAQTYGLPEARLELTTSGRTVVSAYDLRRVTLRDGHARPAGSLLVLRDITELKTAEQQIRQLNAQLEQRVRDRTLELETTIQQLREEMEERQSAEAALRESEARYRTLVDISPNAIMLLDLTGHVLMASAKAQALHAPSAGDGLEGEDVMDLIAPQDREHARAHLQSFLSGPHHDTAEFTFERPDGTQFVAEINASTVPDKSGRPTAIIGALHDVTERRKAEDQLRRRQTTLELLSRASQVFNSSLQLDHVLTTVLDEVRSGLDALVCSVWLLDPATGDVICRQASGPHNDLVRGWRLAPGQGVAGWVIQQGESVNLADVQADSRHYAGVDQETGLPLRSMLAVPLRGRQSTLGVIEVANLQVGQFKAEDLTFLELLAFTAGSAIENAALYEHAQREITQRTQAEATLSAANLRLQALSRQLVDVQETERRRLALELHDELGQMLNSIKLSLDLMPADPTSDSQEPLRRAQRLIGQLIQQVRQLALDLRPAMLDDLGLVPALKSFFRRQTSQTGLHIDFENGVADSRRFPPIIETAAYRIIQEGVTNATRHAEVRHITVELQADDHVLHLEVRDQGRGFDAAALLAPGTSTGLAGMRERAGLLGGNLVIESAPGAGTRLRANLPLA